MQVRHIDFKFLLKSDDDTFVCVKRLAAFLHEQPREVRDSIYAGVPTACNLRTNPNKKVRCRSYGSSLRTFYTGMPTSQRTRGTYRSTERQRDGVWYALSQSRSITKGVRDVGRGLAACTSFRTA